MNELKAALLLVCAFVNQGVESFKDGFQVKDLFNFLDEGLQVNEMISNGAKIKDQINGLTGEQRLELVAAVKEHLNLSEGAEAVTENGLMTISYAYATVMAIGQVKKAA
jgi:hypothetical protein